MFNFKKPHKKMKILNLYAGIGGNRKLWADVDSNGKMNETTAKEIEPLVSEYLKGKILPITPHSKTIA